MAAQNSTNPILKALHSLLPPSSTIQPRLISAAESLLAISRQRISHLKSEEEIARPHICAEIACRRLRAQLRLPNIKSGNGAPCRPPIYRKLLSSFEQTLGDIELLGTPKGRKQTESQTPTTGRSTGKSTAGRKRNIEALNLDDDEDTLETPTKKRRSNSTLATPTKSSGKKTINEFVGKILASTTKATPSEEYVPLIRKLCNALKTTKMVPHVYTGAVIIDELAQEEDDSVTSGDSSVTKSQRQLSLIIAIYLLTLTRMQKGMMTEEIYDSVLQKSLQLLQIDEHKAEMTTRVEEWIARVNDEEWTSIPGKGFDWWSTVPEDTIPPLKMSAIMKSTDDTNDVVALDPELTPKAHRGSGQTRSRMLTRREELRKQLDEDDPEGVLLPGLGTMMNDAVDYFSEERNAEYEMWEAGIFKELEARGL